MTSVLLRASVLAASLAAAVPAAAVQLSLLPDSESQVTVGDAATGLTTPGTLTAPSGLLRVALGGIAADGSRQLAFVAINPNSTTPPDDTTTIQTIAYGGTAAPANSATIPAGRTVSVLLYDAPRTRLVGVLQDDSHPTPGNEQPTQLFTVDAAQATGLGAPAVFETAADCCSISAGVAVWLPTTQELLVVGRRSADGGDQLLRFTLSGPGPYSPDAFPILDERLGALAYDASDGTLYGVARSTMGVTHLVEITYSTSGSPVVLTSVGDATTPCCFASPGAAVIDTDAGGRALFMLAADGANPSMQTLTRIALDSGTFTTVNPVSPGFGLWSDAAVDSDRIFYNGFE